MMRKAGLILILCPILLAACGQETALSPDERFATQAGPATSTGSARGLSGAEGEPTVSPTLIPPLTFTPSPTVTEIPTLSPTPDPYWTYTMEYLTGREYGNGNLDILEVLADNTYFTRYAIRYPSEELMIYGFLDVPKAEGPPGPGPYPFIIALHGYIDPAIYTTIDYTTGYADALARAGYIVLHPNLRGYPPSDEGDNLFRVGMAIDVLNLIGIVQQNDWEGTPLENGDPSRLGLWGHSMGGGIATRVMLVSPEVDAVVLYAAMSGDEKQNWEAIHGWSGGQRGLEELSVLEEELPRISPAFFFEWLTAPVSIHHGRVDELVPLRWSVATCDALMELGKNVECWYYENMPHTFYGEGDQLFVTRTIQFFDGVLK
ncbi:MAG TPA: alpha/beta fold hydrolase [Anaerolineales bacterium]|nr:alpha/beta fold hydrolase [Anaerolineales bacterium]